MQVKRERIAETSFTDNIATYSQEYDKGVKYRYLSNVIIP